MRVLGSVLLLLIVSGFLVSARSAGKANDGRALYKANCKVCHDKGSPNKQYAPMTLTQEQWRRFYTVKLTPSHNKVVHPGTGKRLLESLTPDQIKAIQRFCIDHAADSEQPATCG